jgi:hypothetical protein
MKMILRFGEKKTNSPLESFQKSGGVANAKKYNDRSRIFYQICAVNFLMVSADVIIAGVGPARSTIAKEIAESGNALCDFLDKAVFPRDKVCAGGLLFIHSIFSLTLTISARIANIRLLSLRPG